MSTYGMLAVAHKERYETYAALYSPVHPRDQVHTPCFRQRSSGTHRVGNRLLFSAFAAVVFPCSGKAVYEPPLARFHSRDQADKIVHVAIAFREHTMGCDSLVIRFGETIDVERSDSPFPGPAKRNAPARSSTAARKAARMPWVSTMAGAPASLRSMPATKCGIPISLSSLRVFLKAALQAIEHVVVGQREDVEACACDGTDQLRRANHPRLAGHITPVARKRELQVAETQVAVGHSAADRGREQGQIAMVRNAAGRRAKQQVADGCKSNDSGGHVSLPHHGAFSAKRRSEWRLAAFARNLDYTVS